MEKDTPTILFAEKPRRQIRSEKSRTCVGIFPLLGVVGNFALSKHQSDLVFVAKLEAIYNCDPGIIANYYIKYKSEPSLEVSPKVNKILLHKALCLSQCDCIKNPPCVWG